MTYFKKFNSFLFQGKNFEQSHDFQAFLENLKRKRDDPAVVSGENMFTGHSGSVGLPIFCSNLGDVTQNSLVGLPNFGGAFLVMGKAGECCRVCQKKGDISRYSEMFIFSSASVMCVVEYPRCP